MDEIERKNYEATAQELRTDLKGFEGDWAKQNSGSKPSREDIKKNPDIGNISTYTPISQMVGHLISYICSQKV